MFKVLYKISILILLSVVLHASPSGDSIIISEVVYDAPTPDNASEWFELYNPTGSSIDISGWSFSDGEGTATVPAGTPVIAPGAYFIATHTATAGELTHHVGVVVNLEYGAMDVGPIQLSNSGDELTLSDDAGVVVDFVSWEGHTTGWNIEAGDAKSIARSNSIDTDLEADWIGQQEPTPGIGTLHANVPTASSDNVTLNEDATANILVIDNDNFGADGPSSSAIQISTQPTHGVAEVNDAGTPLDPTDDSIDYAPNPNFNGSDLLTYTISDNSGDTANATVQITVISQPDFPTANDDTVSADAGESAVVNILSNDTGLNTLDVTTVLLLNVQGNGVTQLVVLGEGVWNADTNNGTLHFTPEEGFSGSPTPIRYTVADNEGAVSNQATVTIYYIQEPPHPTDNLDVNVSSGGVTVIDVLGNGDSFGTRGPGNKPLQFTQPQFGSISLDDGGTPSNPLDDVLLYMPSSDMYEGNDSFTYTITDAANNTATATVTLVIVCKCIESSDSVDAFNFSSIFAMIFLTLMLGYYFARDTE